MKKLKNFISEILVPVLLFVFLSNIVGASRNSIDFMDKFRPLYGEISMAAHVEKQILHLDALSHSRDPSPRVLFVGSSSVVNGIDVKKINQKWESEGLKYKAYNFGLTRLLAYELPFLKEYFLAPGVESIVYLYNTFSFSDNFHPAAVYTRWNTLDYFINYSSSRLFFKDRDQIVTGLIANHIFLYKFRNIIRAMFIRIAQGKLIRSAYDYDYKPGINIRGIKREREYAIPISLDAPYFWMRADYLTSSTNNQTMGYKGLRRFIQLAKMQNIPIIIAPIPEPIFSNYDPYKQGTMVSKVDNWVSEIIFKNGGEYIGREEVAIFEEDDFLFADSVHFNDTGREVYTSWLAERLKKLFGK